MTELPPVRPTRITLLIGNDVGDPIAFEMLLQIARDVGLKVFRFKDRVELVGPAQVIANVAQSFDAAGFPRAEWN